MRIVLVWLALLAALAGAPAAALQQFPPRPAVPVSDGADIIPAAEEAALNAKLTAYNQRTGRALVVASVPTLNGDTIEDYAVRLFESWGIGGKESDSGLLLLVAPTERKVRIEVGYGLHEYVTDILSGRIIRDQITPRFKAGDFAGGINAGVNSLIQQLDRTPADAKAIAEAAAAAERTRGASSDGGSSIGGFIFWVIAILVLTSLMARRSGGRAYRGRGSGLGNVIMWSALNAAMNSGRSSGDGWGGGGGGFGGGGGGGFGGFGGGGSGGGGASGSW